MALSMLVGKSILTLDLISYLLLVTWNSPTRIAFNIRKVSIYLSTFTFFFLLKNMSNLDLIPTCHIFGHRLGRTFNNNAHVPRCRFYARVFHSFRGMGYDT